MEDSQAAGPRVGYIMSRFPKLTETFILYEILSLARQGVTVEVYPLHRERCRVVHPDAAPLVARARYSHLLGPGLWLSNLYWLCRRPLAYLGAWATCLRATWGSARYFTGVLAAVPLAAHIARRMQRDRVQHVHAHFASHPAAAALVVARLTGLPFSFTAHGSDLHRERRMLREKLAECQFAVTISEYNREWMVREGGEQVREKIHVVHCGVDPALFDGGSSAPQQAAEQAALEILCIGSLHEVKGQSHLIRACAQLRREGAGFQLHLVGEGPDDAALRQLAEDEGIAGCTTFHGGLSRPQVIERLSRADMVAAPSVVSHDGRREGIPVVLMEAMAARLPVVSSRLSGIPELVEDGETGLLTAPGDVAALADALRRLADSPELRSRLGAAGREKVLREFDLDCETGRLAELFGRPPAAAEAGMRRGDERMTLLWQWIFWLSAGLLAYTYVGFPLLVLLRAALFPRPWRRGDGRPSVTVLVAAYNEAGCITEKLDSLCNTDYPSRQLEIIVVSDGSTDGTDELVSRHPSPLVRLLSVPRSGKAAALNAAAPLASGEILVFTDANSIFTPDSLPQLVAPFADPAVGGVAGDQRYLKGGREAAAGKGERSYWGIDRCLKRLESAAGNTISATGAIYAVRRELFQGVPEGVTDDFAVSTAVIQQGFRLVFCGEAVAIEPVAGSSRQEFGRKVRVMTRGFRAVWLRRRLLNPFRYGFYSLQLFSHKVLRRVMVFPLAALLATSLLLWQQHWLYGAAAWAQLAFYGLALLALPLGRVGLPRLLSLPFFFCLVNVAAAVALLRTLTGSRVTLWETQRSDTLPSAPS